MPDLRTGTVMFLFTESEDCTTRWKQHPVAMRAALAAQYAVSIEE